MRVLFFKVEDLLNYEGTEAVAPSGRKGIASDRLRFLRDNLQASSPGTQLVLYGEWAKDWDFDDNKCTPDGIYLNKKLDRKGLHIMDKAEGENGIEEYMNSHHIDSYTILR